MVTIEFEPEDLAGLRFGFSPMWELVMSYRVLQNPTRHPLFSPWVREAVGVLRGKDLAYLSAVVCPEGYFPDYLTPTPRTPSPSIVEELERIHRTPLEAVRDDAARVFSHSNPKDKVLRCFLDRPERALERLINDLKAYWNAAVARHWPRLQRRLEGDVLRRAQQLALEGSHALLGGLHPQLAVEGNVLKLPRKHDRQVRPAGLGILLVPVFFSWPDLYYLAEPGERTLIGYSPVGTALWEGGPEAASQSLELALGKGRAKVLGALQTPRTPSTLAEALGVSVGAVSQQLGRLRKAGLVEPHRLGRQTFYKLTPRGMALMRLFELQS